jgi:hypothetical protein
VCGSRYFQGWTSSCDHIVTTALIFWLLGHLLLWIIFEIIGQGRAGQGRKLKTDTETNIKSWPLSLLILTVLLGGVFIFGAMAIILLIVLENDCLSDMPTILALWLPPSLCFIGILLRKPWSRALAGGGFIALALFIGQHILRSPRIKAFYAE